MKLLGILSLALLLSAFAPGNASAAQNDMIKDTAMCGCGQKVVMTVDPATYSGAPAQVKLTVANRTDEMIQFGADYRVEKLGADGRTWSEVQFPQQIAVIAIMYMLPAGESKTYDVSLYPDMATYGPGRYRIKKQIVVGEHSHPFYAEFELR